MRRGGVARTSLLGATLALTLGCVSVVVAQGPITGETIKKPRAVRPPAPADGPLTLALVSRHTRWASVDPKLLGWSPDGRSIHYTLTPRDEVSNRRTIAYDRERGTARELDPTAEATRIPCVFDAMGTARRDRGGYARHRVTYDRRRQVFVRKGDLWLHDVVDGSSLRLTRSADAVTSPRFSLDERRVLFVQRNNVHELDLASGLTRQLTDLRRGPRPRPKTPQSNARSAQEKRLVAQQADLFAWAKAKHRARTAKEARADAADAADPDRLRPVYLPRDETARIESIAPTGRWIVIRLTKRSSSSSKRTAVPDYVTESGFAETRSSRTKVGAEYGQRRWMLLDVEAARLRAIAPPPLAKADATYGPFAWSPDGTKLAALAIARDYRTRWILTVDPLSMETHVTDAEHDAAWIGGPAWRRFGWLDDSQRLWFTSERTGWAHLYVAHHSGRSRRALTEGAWEVQNVRLSWDREQAWIIGTAKHPGERHVYSLRLDEPQPALRCLTAQLPGIDTVAFSPDETRFAVVHSTPTTPPSISTFEIGANTKIAPPQLVQRGATDPFRTRAWTAPKIVQFPDRHGNATFARLFVPKTPHRMRPAVIRVHGSGYAQSAHRRWQRANDFFFIQLLVERGYHVLDLDYRGSAGYGRGCRTDIAGHMGSIELDSGVAAVDFLIAKHGVERERIGIFGGSYGGFYTLMALLKKPGLFKAGVSLYPVTDWQHYNHWYAARILGTPEANPGAYRRSSPIYHAQHLRDRLMIQHGVVDTNVHYQDTMRFAQRLVELEKTGWDVVSYPVEGHGWRHASTRLDSYRRMLALFNEVLLRPTVL